MVIGIVQMDIAWGDGFVNRSKIEAYIDNALSMADVVVLPEMFASGFSMNSQRVAEPFKSSPTLQWMQGCAIKYKKAIVGSVAISDNDTYYNRLFFVSDDGSYKYYDKRHLFRMSGEDKSYSAGSDKLIVEYKGVRFLPLVCYDLRFPVWSRMNDTEYDVMIYIASWPDIRIYAWDTLLRARAIENLSYVIGVNRVGSDRANNYNGHSVILDYMGGVVTAAEGEECAMAFIDIENLHYFRKNFPTYLDSDNFEIKENKSVKE